MSNGLALAVLTAALFSNAAGETRWMGDAPRSARIGVFLDFDHDPSQSLVQAMEREVGSVLAATGAQFSWLKLNADLQTETFDDLAVLRFQGSCRTEAPSRQIFPRAERITLASADLSSDSVTSYGSVLCDQIKTHISGLLDAPELRDRETVLGRALGRVVAHELYHILAKTEEHTVGGITKALQTPLDLVRENFHLDRQALQWLRQRLQITKAVSFQHALKTDR